MSALIGSVTGAISGGILKAQVALEHEAIMNNPVFLGQITDEQANYIQLWLRYFKFTPDPAGILKQTVIISLIVPAIIYGIYELGMMGYDEAKPVILFHWKLTIAILVIIVIAIIMLGWSATISILLFPFTLLWSGIVWLYKNLVPASTQAFLAKPANSIEGFLEKSSLKDAQTDPERMTLVNLQPVAVKQIGYAGPTEKGGSFKPDTAILAAVQAGVRFFTLQIDYLETAKTGDFAAANVPTLLYRNGANELVSTNGASIADIAKNLSIYAFNKDFPSNAQPLVLYLHFVRTPNYITKPDAYMKFLSDVAEALGPIQPHILHSNENTDFTRQQNEKALVYTPVTLFENKIILITNADTSIFRHVDKLSMSAVPLDKDLDYMTCARAYLEDATDDLGVTSLASEHTPYVVVASYARLRGISGKMRDDYAIRGKGRFVIAMPTMADTPSQADIQSMMKTLAVNVVPMNLFGATDPELKTQIDTWATKPFYNLKPVMLQSMKVAVAGYTPPPGL
jgi:hypothetical protein